MTKIRSRNVLSSAEIIRLARELEPFVIEVEHKGEKVWVWKDEPATSQKFERKWSAEGYTLHNVGSVARSAFVPFLGTLPPEPAPPPAPPSDASPDMLRIARTLEKLGGGIGHLRMAQNAMRRDVDALMNAATSGDGNLAERISEMERRIEALLKDNLAFRADIIKRLTETERVVVETQLKVAALENNSSVKVRA